MGGLRRLLNVHTRYWFNIVQHVLSPHLLPVFLQVLLQVHGLHLESGQLLQAFHLHHVGRPLLERLAVLVEGQGFGTVELLHQFCLGLSPIQSPHNQEVVRVFLWCLLLFLLRLIIATRGVSSLLGHAPQSKPLSLGACDTR